MTYSASTKYYASVIGASLSWFALILQLYLIITNRSASINETIIRYFTFYTILTNFIVAFCFTAEVINKRNSFFTRPATLAATVVYIGVVGLVYNVILRYAWQPTGMQKVVDELLHLIIPMYYILYWVLFVPKIKIRWINLLSWLIYPLIYLSIIMLRGMYSGYYPYPFVNVSALGYKQVAINCGFVLLAFLIFSFIIIVTSRKFVKAENT